MANKKNTLKIGDKVAYPVQFLRNIGCSHSNLAQGRGEIIELKDYGVILATIKWFKGTDLPDKVNVGNLAKIGPNSKFCNVD